MRHDEVANDLFDVSVLCFMHILSEDKNSLSA